MKNLAELENEYKEFIIKFTKSAKDFNNDLAKLSPENQQRFMRDLKNLVRLNIPRLINFTKD